MILRTINLYGSLQNLIFTAESNTGGNVANLYYFVATAA